MNATDGASSLTWQDDDHGETHDSGSSLSGADSAASGSTTGYKDHAEGMESSSGSQSSSTGKASGDTFGTDYAIVTLGDPSDQIAWGDHHDYADHWDGETNASGTTTGSWTSDDGGDTFTSATAASGANASSQIESSTWKNHEEGATSADGSETATYDGDSRSLASTSLHAEEGADRYDLGTTISLHVHVSGEDATIDGKTTGTSTTTVDGSLAGSTATHFGSDAGTYDLSRTTDETFHVVTNRHADGTEDSLYTDDGQSSDSFAEHIAIGPNRLDITSSNAATFHAEGTKTAAGVVTSTTSLTASGAATFLLHLENEPTRTTGPDPGYIYDASGQTSYAIESRSGGEVEGYIRDAEGHSEESLALADGSPPTTHTDDCEVHDYYGNLPDTSTTRTQGPAAGGSAQGGGICGPLPPLTSEFVRVKMGVIPFWARFLYGLSDEGFFSAHWDFNRYSEGCQGLLKRRFDLDDVPNSTLLRLPTGSTIVWFEFAAGRDQLPRQPLGPSPKGCEDLRGSNEGSVRGCAGRREDPWAENHARQAHGREELRDLA